MNKTVTINISGIIFHIEEDAYEKLSHYLSTIKGYFSSDESGNEIIADIESRIAELLQMKISQYKQVVLMADVDEVINALGKPEEFGIDQESTAQNSSQRSYSGDHIKRRLFRDPDEKAIGGVCSGLANYFDVDVVWIRLATFLLIFFGGVSLWVYIILWIVIPEARTAADKLAMKGERVNIDNISKTFKEEMSGVKSRFHKYGHEAEEGFRRGVQYSRRGAGHMGYALATFFRIVGRLFGLFLVFIGIAFMIALMAMLTGISIGGHSAEAKHWIEMIFIDSSHYWIGLFGILLVIGIPAFMLLYTGIKLVFNIRYSNRWLNLSAGMLWLLGLIMSGYIAVQTANDFSNVSKHRDLYTIEPDTTQVFLLTAKPASESSNAYGLTEMSFDEDKAYMNGHELSMATLKDKKVIVGGADLKIQSSNSGKIEIAVVKKSNGSDKKSAFNKAQDIVYTFDLDSTKLRMDEIFYIDEMQKFRGQEVIVYVKIPVGQKILLDKSLANVIDDVDNVSNTYDQDMLGRRWIMTDEGLACIDCEGLKANKSNHPLKHKVRINKHGIEVQNEEAEIIINENGIKVNSEGKNIEVKDREKED